MSRIVMKFGGTSVAVETQNNLGLVLDGRFCKVESHSIFGGTSHGNNLVRQIVELVRDVFCVSCWLVVKVRGALDRKG